MNPWHVLPCAAHQELSLEKKIRSLGYGAMAPWYDGKKYVRGKSRSWRRPLYIGYVFVSFPDHADGWQHLCSEFNTEDRRVVFRLLGGDVPASLRSADVEYLASIADGKYSQNDEAEQLVVGDCVLIPDGHLKGETGIVVEISDSKSRGRVATLVPKETKIPIYLKRRVAILRKV